MRNNIAPWPVILGTLFCTSLSSFAENPQNVKIQNVTANGSGCSAGTVRADISPDFSAFTVLMDNYLVESNGNRQTDRKNCDVKVELQIPQGWSYAVIAVDYRGFAAVDEGSIVTHQVSYVFDGETVRTNPGLGRGNARHAVKATEFKGPFSDNYYIRNEIHRNSAPWSPCTDTNRQTLNILTELQAKTINNLAQSQALLALDSIDGQVQAQNYRLAWKKCNPGRGRTDRDMPGRENPGRGIGRGRVI